MAPRLHSEDVFAAAVRALIERDARLAAVLETAGMPTLRRRPSGFSGLAAIVCGQQLSTASAAAIWERLSRAFDPFDPARIGRARASTLARLGLSKAKIKTLKLIGTAVAKGDINLESVAELPAEEAHAALVRLHGIGPWTADLYLLFCLGHADAWPAGDLALQEAARIAFGLRRRPDIAEMTKLAEGWRPWRGVAAHLLWNYYRAVKKREGAPLRAAPSTAKPVPLPVQASRVTQQDGGHRGRRTRRTAA